MTEKGGVLEIPCITVRLVGFAWESQETGLISETPGPPASGGGSPGHAGLQARGGQRGHCLFQRLFLEALLDALPVCIKGRDQRGIVKIVGQDCGVVIEPKIVVGAIDPPLLTLRELREPGGKEHEGQGFRSSHALGGECSGAEAGRCKPQVTGW